MDQRPSADVTPPPGAAADPESGARSRSTITAVATRAGVSKQTVSNVLNFPARVAPATTERVLRAIEDLNFTPDRAARQLRTRRSQVLGMRMEPAVGNLVFDRFLHAMCGAAAAVDHRIMLYAAADDRAEIAALEELLDGRNIDGLILTSTHAGDVREPYLAKAGVPFVSFGRSWDRGVDYDWVDVDGAAGTEAAVAHLAGLGHRAIGFLGWPVGSGVGDDRLAGWERACTHRGTAALPPARAVDTLPDAEAAARALLAEHRPTAIVCASDTLALGASAAVAAAGLTVGRDVSLIGFDDSSLAAAAGLSSLAQPLVDAADAILALFLDRQRHPTGPPVHRLLPPDLRLRASVGPPL